MAHLARVLAVLAVGASASAWLGACSSGAGSGENKGPADASTAKPCLVDPDCEDKDPCTIDTCESAKCKQEVVPDGLAPDQTQGDCTTIECKNGVAAVSVDDGDIPDDDESCTFDQCKAGIPINEPKLDDTACEVGSGNGNCKGGKCVVLCTPENADTQCDDLNPCTEDACLPCTDFACRGQGKCDHHALNNVPTPGASQRTGDCVEVRCIDGKSEEAVDDLDVPDDSIECTDDICKSGLPAHPPEPPGTACGGTGSDYICDGQGECVSCLTAADCDDSYGGTCSVKACKDGYCQGEPKPAGTSCGAQGQICNDNGSCCSTCQSNGYECGTTSDGCGGSLSCGSCATGQVCQGGQCCLPKTCTAGVSCGTQSDGCGGTITCGTCPAGDQCSGGVCGCVNGVQNGSETDVDCGGSCAKKCASAQSCLAGSDCTTGACAEGICCNTSCTGECRSCMSSKTGLTTGICGNVLDNTDPDNECPNALPQTCLTTGVCKAGACEFHPSSVQCGTSSCSGNTLMPTDYCSGSGTCVDAGQTSCATPYVCGDPYTCQSCSDGIKNGNEVGIDCGGGGSCNKCGNGVQCTSGVDCVSGYCVDGYCCNTACNGVCVACNLSAKHGTCSPIPNNADPASECPGNNSCNGAGACQ
jgi:hypothetical protein